MFSERFCAFFCFSLGLRLSGSSVSAGCACGSGAALADGGADCEVEDGDAADCDAEDGAPSAG
jgi:hypothetical protein